jgi:hypothetical protein
LSQEVTLRVGEARSRVDSPKLEETPASEAVSEHHRRHIVHAVPSEHLAPDQAALTPIASGQSFDAEGEVMVTLHIEHRITDFDTWASAFNRFADVRRDAGVQAHRVQRPVDDPAYVVIDLDFATTEQAKAFLSLLNAKVWAVRENSPALTGTPQTMVLGSVETLT